MKSIVLFLCASVSLVSGIFILEEAAQVALECGQTLLADKALFGKIEFELPSIRKVYRPQVGDIFHQPKWVPGQLIFVNNTVTADTRAKLAKINQSRYGPVTVTFVGRLYNTIDFGRAYQPEILAGIIGEEFGLRTTPNFYVGRNSTIECNRWSKEYLFSRGSGDCPSGCTLWQRYLFQEAENGRIFLVWKSENVFAKTLFKDAVSAESYDDILRNNGLDSVNVSTN